VLDKGQLWEYTNWKRSSELHNDSIHLNAATVREAQNSERRFCFELVTPVRPLPAARVDVRNSNECIRRCRMRIWSRGSRRFVTPLKVLLTGRRQHSIFSLQNLRHRILNDIPLAICLVPRAIKIEEQFLDLKKQENCLLEDSRKRPTTQQRRTYPVF